MAMYVMIYGYARVSTDWRNVGAEASFDSISGGDRSMHLPIGRKWNRLLAITAVAGVLAGVPAAATTDESVKTFIHRACLGAKGRPLSFAIPDFGSTSSRVAGRATDLSRFLRDFLERSGPFSLVNTDDVDDRSVGVNVVPRFSDWRSRNVDILVVGEVTDLPDGRFRVQFRVWDIPAGQTRLGFTYVGVVEEAWQRVGPLIAEKINECLRGVADKPAENSPTRPEPPHDDRKLFAPWQWDPK
jgi:TolB protein